MQPRVIVRGEIAPGQPIAHELAVWAPSTVTVTITHTHGALGPFTLDIFDAAIPRAPIGHDSTTCVEPGCSMRAEVEVARGTTELVVRVESTVEVGVSLEIVAATKPAVR